MVAYPQAGFRLLCFPGVVLLSRGGRRAGDPYRWKHCTPTFLFFLHFRPRCVIWTSVAADILSALCWGSGVKPRPLFHCSLLFIVTLWMRFSLLCLFLLPCWWTRFKLVLYTKWLFSYQTGFSPIDLIISVWLAPWPDRIVVDFRLVKYHDEARNFCEELARYFECDITNKHGRHSALIQNLPSESNLCACMFVNLLGYWFLIAIFGEEMEFLNP